MTLAQMLLRAGEQNIPMFQIILGLATRKHISKIFFRLWTINTHLELIPITLLSNNKKAETKLL